MMRELSARKFTANTLESVEMAEKSVEGFHYRCDFSDVKRIVQAISRVFEVARPGRKPGWFLCVCSVS